MEIDDGTLNKRGEAYCACRYLACGRKFKSLKSLEQHLITYHNITWEAYARYSPTRHHETMEESVDDQLLGKRKDAYCTCTYMECGRKFKMLKSLEEHVTLYHNISWQLYTQYYHRSVRKTGEDTAKSKSPKTEKKDVQAPKIKSPKSTSPRGSGSWYSDSDSSPYVPVTVGMSPSVPTSPVVSFMPPSSAAYIPTQYPYMTAQVPLVPTIIQYQPMLTPPMLGYAPSSTLPISPGYYGQSPLSIPDPTPWLSQMHQQDSGILNLSCPKSKPVEKENLPGKDLEARDKTFAQEEARRDSFTESYQDSQCHRFSSDLDISKGIKDYSNRYRDRGFPEKKDSERKTFPETTKGIIVIEPDDQFDEKISRDPSYVPQSLFPNETKSTQIVNPMYHSNDREECNNQSQNRSYLKTSQCEPKILDSYNSYLPTSNYHNTPPEISGSNLGQGSYFPHKNIPSAIMNVPYKYCDNQVIDASRLPQKASSTVVRDEVVRNQSPVHIKSQDVRLSDLTKQVTCQEQKPHHDAGKLAEKKQCLEAVSPVTKQLKPVDYSMLRSSDSCGRSISRLTAPSRRLGRSASLPNLRTLDDEEDPLISVVKPLCIDLTNEGQKDRKRPKENSDSSSRRLKKQAKLAGCKKNRRRKTKQGTKSKKATKYQRPNLAMEHGMRTAMRLKKKYLVGRYKKKKNKIIQPAQDKRKKKSKQKLASSDNDRKRKSTESFPLSRAKKTLKYLFDPDCDSTEGSGDHNELMVGDKEDSKDEVFDLSLKPRVKNYKSEDDWCTQNSPLNLHIEATPAVNVIENREHVGSLVREGDSPQYLKPLSESAINMTRCQRSFKVPCLKELAEKGFRSFVHSLSDRNRLGSYSKSLGLPWLVDIPDTEVFDEEEPMLTIVEESPLPPPLPPPVFTPNIRDSTNVTVQYQRHIPSFVCAMEEYSMMELKCNQCGIEESSPSNYLKHRFAHHGTMKCRLCEKEETGSSYLYRYTGTLLRHLTLRHGLITVHDPHKWTFQTAYAGLDLDGLQYIQDIDNILHITDSKIFLPDSILSYKLVCARWTRGGLPYLADNPPTQYSTPKADRASRGAGGRTGGDLQPGPIYPRVIIQITDVQTLSLNKNLHKRDRSAFDQSSKVKYKSRNVSSSV